MFIKKKWTSPIRGIEPRAAAVKSFGLKGGDVSRYTISDVMDNIIPPLTIQTSKKLPCGNNVSVSVSIRPRSTRLC